MDALHLFTLHATSISGMMYQQDRPIQSGVRKLNRNGGRRESTFINSAE